MITFDLLNGDAELRCHRASFIDVRRPDPSWLAAATLSVAGPAQRRDALFVAASKERGPASGWNVNCHLTPGAGR